MLCMVFHMRDILRQVTMIDYVCQYLSTFFFFASIGQKEQTFNNL